jgi:hypothetical protein
MEIAVKGNSTKHCGTLSSLPTGIQLRIQVFWVVRLSGRVTDNRRFEQKLQHSQSSNLLSVTNQKFWICIFRAVRTWNLLSNSVDEILKPVYSQCLVFVDKPTFRAVTSVSSPAQTLKLLKYTLNRPMDQTEQVACFCLLLDCRKLTDSETCVLNKNEATYCTTLQQSHKSLDSASAFPIFALNLSSSNRRLHWRAINVIPGALQGQKVR